MALICKGKDCNEVIRPVTPPGGLSSRTKPLVVRCPKCGTENSFSPEQIDKSEASASSGAS
jgi:hypothetical protein